MKDPDADRRQAVALFRYGLIADLVHLPPGEKGLYRKLQEKAAVAYCIPGTTRTRVAAETLRDWLKAYRQGGFEALMPKPRTDRGRSRGLPPAVVDALLSIKEAHPKLSVRLVIAEARKNEHVPATLPLPPSTVETQNTFHVPVEQLPHVSDMESCPVAALFFVKYCPDAASPAIRSLSKGEAGARLYAHGLNQLAHANAGLDAAVAIAKTVPSYALDSADLAATCTMVASIPG